MGEVARNDATERESWARPIDGRGEGLRSLESFNSALESSRIYSGGKPKCWTVPEGEEEKGEQLPSQEIIDSCMAPRTFQYRGAFQRV